MDSVSTNEQKSQQNLCETSELAFTGAGRSGVKTATSTHTTNTASDADFDLVNRSSQSIIQVFVTPQASNSWGNDRLPGTLAPGARFKVTLPRDGICNYDVRVVYQDRTSAERLRQNLCTLSELIFR
jgi:hypothetical protein